MYAPDVEWFLPRPSEKFLIYPGMAPKLFIYSWNRQLQSIVKSRSVETFKSASIVKSRSVETFKSASIVKSRSVETFKSASIVKSRSVETFKSAVHC